VSATNNPLDVAINGSGFFRMSNNGAISYSRNGQFQLDKNGGIVNAQGLALTGYIADVNGVLSTGSAVPLTINTNDIAPKETDKVTALFNLDSRAPIPGTVAGVPPAITVPFLITDPTTYNNSTSVAVFDSLGNSHILQTYYVRVDPLDAARVPVDPLATSQWDVFASVDGVLVPRAASTPVDAMGTMEFNAFGQLLGTQPGVATDPKALFIDINVSPIASTPTSGGFITFDLTGSTQFGSAFSVNSLKQDGYTSGKLSKFNTSKDGTIVGSYTNGKTSVLGQVALSNFTNPNGLQSTGDNQWTETSTSGPALVGAPTTGSLGALTSSATEDSNTDLTGDLVNLITAQRIYQANAQTIKTQDQILQTLVNLR
jgi:flagellar hook protein FlgE